MGRRERAAEDIIRALGAQDAVEQVVVLDARLPMTAPDDWREYDGGDRAWIGPTGPLVYFIGGTEAARREVVEQMRAEARRV